MTEHNGRVHQYGADAARPAKAPFVFRVDESPEITVHEPDAGTVMDIEEAQTSRRTLRLFVGGEQWSLLEEHLERQHPDVLVDLARDISRHFGMFDASSAANRAERRRRARR